MSDLPFILPNGIVAVYGVGQQGTSPQGLTIEENWRFGTVYNIWDGGATYIYGGDVVFFKETEQYARIVTSNNLTYTLLDYTRLVTEAPPPP